MRNTWWLVFVGTTAYLRVEEQHSASSVPHLDRSSHAPGLWSAPTRTEYVGTLSRKSAPFTLKLQRRFGPREPATLTLGCTARQVAVHPAFATLAEGWKNDDETMEPGSWAPPRTERVSAIGCQVVGEAWPFPFGEGLCFAAGKTTTKLETAGLEWAFVNSDMVIQEGGYRFIPSFSLVPP